MQSFYCRNTGNRDTFYEHGINQGLLTTLAVFGIPGRIGTLPDIVVIFVEETVAENQRSG